MKGLGVAAATPGIAFAGFFAKLWLLPTEFPSHFGPNCCDGKIVVTDRFVDQRNIQDIEHGRREGDQVCVRRL